MPSAVAFACLQNRSVYVSFSCDGSFAEKNRAIEMCREVKTLNGIRRWVAVEVAFAVAEGVRRPREGKGAGGPGVAGDDMVVRTGDGIVETEAGQLVVNAVGGATAVRVIVITVHGYV